MGRLPTRSTPAAVAHKGKIFFIASAIALIYFSRLAETRAVPRSSSRSFRFPSSNDEYDMFKDSSSTLFLSKHTRENNNPPHVENNQGRNAIITLDSNPVKSSVPQSPVNPFKSDQVSLEDTLSSVERIDGDDEASGDDHEKSVHEDKLLRDVLCPSTDKSTSLNNSSLNPSGSRSVISATTDSNKFRYDLQVGKCAEIGKREHCGENMIFVSDLESSAYGYCECDFENRILRKEEQQAALLTKKPLVFHASTNSCFRLYERGYCDEGEWLVLSKEEKRAVCKPNRCSTESARQEDHLISGARATGTNNRRRASKLLTPLLWTDGTATKTKLTEEKNKNVNGSAHIDGNVKSVWVPLNGSGPCVKLFERNSEHCGDDEQVVFNVGDVVPKCGFVGRGIEGRAIIRNACPVGSYYSIIGRCQPDWDF